MLDAVELINAAAALAQAGLIPQAGLILGVWQ